MFRCAHSCKLFYTIWVSQVHFFRCKLTRIPRLHNTVLVFFYPIQIRIVSGSHYCGVNVHHVGVTFTLNWCSHSCKNLHFFGVTITLSLFLCSITSGDDVLSQIFSVVFPRGERAFVVRHTHDYSLFAHKTRHSTANFPVPQAIRQN